MAVIIKLGAAGAGGGVGGFGDDDYGLFSTNPDFTIEDASSSSVTLKWSKPYSDVTITNYRVYKFKGDTKPTKLSQFGDPVTTIGSGTSFTYTVNNLVPGIYWFVITTLFYIDDELVENGSLQYEKSKQIVEYDWLICVPSGNSAHLIGKSIDKILSPDMSNISTQISSITLGSFVPVANGNQNLSVLFAAVAYGSIIGATNNNESYVLGIAFVGINKMTVCLIGSTYDATCTAGTEVAYRGYYVYHKSAAVVLDFSKNSNNIALVDGYRRCYSTPCVLDPTSGKRSWVKRNITVTDSSVTSGWDSPSIDLVSGSYGLVIDGKTSLTMGDLTSYASTMNPVYYGWAFYDAKYDYIKQGLYGITHSVSIQNGASNYFYTNFDGLFLIDNNVALYAYSTYSTASGNSAGAAYISNNWRSTVGGDKAGSMGSNWTQLSSYGLTDDSSALIPVNRPNGTTYGKVNFPAVMFKKGSELYAYSNNGSDRGYTVIKTTYSGISSITTWTYVGETSGLEKPSWGNRGWAIQRAYRYSDKTDSFYAICYCYNSSSNKSVYAMFASKDLITFVQIKDLTDAKVGSSTVNILA